MHSTRLSSISLFWDFDCHVYHPVVSLELNVTDYTDIFGRVIFCCKIVIGITSSTASNS